MLQIAEETSGTEESKVEELAPDFGLSGFKRTSAGQRVGIIIGSPINLARMRAFCDAGYPAVQAIVPDLVAAGVDLASMAVRQHIGRWVKTSMEHDGWAPIRTSRVSPGYCFRTGAVYGPKCV